MKRHPPIQPPASATAEKKQARHCLTKQVYDDILEHWNCPVEGSNHITRGKEALDHLYKRQPRDYVKLIVGLLSKEISLSDASLEDLDDGAISAMLLHLREQVLSPPKPPGASILSFPPAKSVPQPAAPSGEWNDDDFDVLADGFVVGRIFKPMLRHSECHGCGH